VPQIYVGGIHLGGATETFDALIDGSLGKMLEENNVSWNTSVDTAPYSFLPDWLHPR
jgi:cysteine synthase A